MHQRPIIMSDTMVIALDNGTKKVTRRPNGLNELNLSPNRWIIEAENLYTDNKGRSTSVFFNVINYTKIDIPCKYGNVGDFLYVKEAYAISEKGETIYRATHTGDKPKKWIPAMFMPPSRSRFFLKINSLKVERLDDITNESAINEGCPQKYKLVSQNWFYELWNKLYPLETEPYKSGKNNPWIWVIGFETISTTGKAAIQ